MGTKKEELKDGCFSRATDDEPLFVLRAQDKLAPNIVRRWAIEFMRTRKNLGLPYEEKFVEVMEIARKMENWPKKKMPD